MSMIDTNTLRQMTRLILTTDLSNRRIAQILSVAPNTVKFYRKRCGQEELNWSLVELFDDTTLLSRLQKKRLPSTNKVMPDWKSLHERLCRNKHLTLEVLHEEYRAVHKLSAYSYSQFTHHYRQYLRKMDKTMRIRRYPGESMEVDFAGTTIPWKDPKTGEKYSAQIFVATMAYSSYSFVLAIRSQRVKDFVEAHVKAFEFFGGIPATVVPDNLKSAVISPGVDPALNKSYQELATYYGYVALPARVRKPKDKAIVEQAVRFISRGITAKLLERQFFSLEEINEAIHELLPRLNQRPMRHHMGSRQSRFEEVEKALLCPLPAKRFQFGEWLPSIKVPSDYHVKVSGHFYSVPHRLVTEHVDVRATGNVIEIHHKNKRVATHPSSDKTGGFTTDKAHMPPQHLGYAEQGLSTYLKWAKAYGESTEAVVRAQYEGKRNDFVIANRACSALKSLAASHDKKEFEAACARAVSIASPTLKSVKSILRTRLYKLADINVSVQVPLPLHQNVRGSSYYQQEGV